MTDQESTNKKTEKPAPNPYESQENVTSKFDDRGVFSSILLVFWYLFLVIAGIAVLGLVAFFVVCMV